MRRIIVLALMILAGPVFGLTITGDKPLVDTDDLTEGTTNLYQDSEVTGWVSSVDLDPGSMLGMDSNKIEHIGGEGFDTDIIVGYEAEYAIYVHEGLEARHKSGKQAKYLEAPSRQFRPEILKVIADEGSKI